MTTETYELRICKTCSREFMPSSRHRSCPICRSKKYLKKPCPGCGKAIVIRHEKCIKCHNGLGSNNPNWKGGVIKHAKGYVLVRELSHPKAFANNGYVFEHIIVMEQSLGRYLLEGENVHHKNGLRSDNSIENLELWVKPQPPGQRVSDLVNWANKFCHTYEGKFQPTKPFFVNMSENSLLHKIDSLERRKNYAGYIFVSYPDHPRTNSKNGFRIFEHIVVMENMLGRYLKPNENVHHRNGVRDDNRPENLELWVVQQPAGQRVTDLLVRAHEILEMYTFAA